MAVQTNEVAGKPADPVQLEAAVYMHDIGMSFLSESIWTKHGRLTNQEVKELRQHPSLGAGILSRMSGWEEAARALRCVSVHCNCKYLTEAQADEVRGAGYWLLCYTVNEPSIARRLFSWGIDAIFTDRLDLIPPDFA